MKTIAFIQRGALTFPSAPSRTCSQGTGLNLLGAPFNSLCTWLKPQLLGLPGSPAPVPHSTGSGGWEGGGGHCLPPPPSYPPTHSAGSSAVLSPQGHGDFPGVPALFTHPAVPHTHTSPLTCSYAHMYEDSTPTPTHTCLYTYPLTVHVHTCLYTQPRKGGLLALPWMGRYAVERVCDSSAHPHFPRVPPSFLVTTV